MPSEDLEYQAITVAVRSLAIDGEQRPHSYDNEADLLHVTVDGSAPWDRRSIICIGNDLFCHLNNERILLRFELLYPRSAWRIAPAMPIPEAVCGGALQFDPRVLLPNTVSGTTMEVLTDLARSYAHIRFGGPLAGASWVALSAQCWGSIAGDQLTELFVAVHPEGEARAPF